MKKIYAGIVAVICVFQLYSQNYTVLGNATALSGCNCFRLTQAANDQGGAIFQNNTIDLANSFDYSFNIYLGCNGAGGADGLAFVLTTNPAALGEQGGGLGYAGPNQPNSLAVEYDTWQNGDAVTFPYDPAYDHIAIESAGRYDHDVAPPVSSLTSQAATDDCNWHSTRIVWNSTTGLFQVYFDGVLRQSITIPNISIYFSGGTVVNWGWSASTGGANNEQQVCVLSTTNWTAGTDYKTCDPTVAFSDLSSSSVGSIQSWAWDFGDGGTATTQNPTHTYASVGTYTVTLTVVDATNCSSTFAHPVTVNAPIALTPVLTSPLCAGDANGSVSVNATGGFGLSGGGYTYTWNNTYSGQTYSNLSAGTYTVSVTDSICSATGTYQLADPTPLTLGIQSSNVPCTGQNNGSITLTVTGGTTPYTYAWNPNVSTTNAATGLSPGNYSITVTDANGCSAMPIITISEPSQSLTATTTQTDLTCYQSNDGSIGVTANGGSVPYTYTWTNNVSTNTTATALAAGAYSITVTDNNNCTATAAVTLTQPSLLAASATATNVPCYGDATATATASVTGGTLGYTYSWSPTPGNTNSITGLVAGTYTVLVTDTNNCTATASATVSQPTQLQITATANSISCNGQADGSIATTTTGGTSPYAYSANDGTNSYPSTTGQYSSLMAGSYSITVTDANSCTATASAIVTEPSALTVLPSTTNATCYSYTNGTIQLTASGGTPQYSYMFSTGMQNASGAEGGLAAGTYSYTVTDANQCSLVDSSIITEPDSVIISVSPTPITVELGDALPLTTATNQTGNVAYYWQPAQGLSCYDCANPTFEGVYNQVYIVEATTDSGCVGTGQFTVTVTPDYRVFFPNIFTPNGDGVNDMWQFFTGSNAIKQLRVQVFNRTGEKVFEATDLSAAWDGTFKGVNAPPGVYTYTANIVWLNNYNDNTYHGTITLIR